MVSTQYRFRYNNKLDNVKLRDRAVENNSADENAIANSINKHALLLTQDALNL